MNKLRLLIVSEQNDFDKKLSSTIKKFSSERNLFFTNLYHNSINWNSNTNLNENCNNVSSSEKVSDKSNNKSFFRGTLLKRCKSSKDLCKNSESLSENQYNQRQSFNLDEFDKKYLFSQNRKNIVKELRKNFENNCVANKEENGGMTVTQTATTTTTTTNSKPPSGCSRRNPTPFKKCEFAANDLEKRLSMREKSVNVNNNNNNNNSPKRIITRHSFYLHRNETNDTYEVVGGSNGIGTGCDDCARVKHKARQLIEMFGRSSNNHNNNGDVQIQLNNDDETISSNHVQVEANNVRNGGGYREKNMADKRINNNNNSNNNKNTDNIIITDQNRPPKPPPNLDTIFITRNNLINTHQKRRSLNAAIVRDNNLYRNLLSDSFEDSKFGIKKSGSVNKIDLELLKSELDDYVDPTWRANISLGYGFRSQRTLRTSRKAFSNSGSMCYNYKNSHSIVLMALCDADYNFLIVDIGASGKRSDGGVFNSTHFGRALKECDPVLNIPGDKCLPGTDVSAPFVVVADEAFPLLKHLLRPFPGRNRESGLPVAESIFNYRLSRARRVIENTFGILSARWRIYRRPILAKRTTVVRIVKATVCLHNWIKSRSSSYCPSGYVDHDGTDGVIVEGRWRRDFPVEGALRNVRRVGANNSTQDPINIRNKFKYFFSEIYKLPWQENMFG